MYLNICLFLLYLINSIKPQTVRIRAVFSAEHDCFSDEEETEPVSSKIPFIRNSVIVKESCGSEDLTLTDNNHTPNRVCACLKIAQVVNPYKDLVPLKIFNSANIQCALCLSIAEQIRTSLEQHKIGLNNPKNEIAEIQNEIRFFCETHFNIQNLRNNLQNFKEIAKFLKYAFNEVDENWTLLLDNLCSKYTGHINIVNFYNVLLEGTSSISNFLCRRDGVFRDCTNVEFNLN